MPEGGTILRKQSRNGRRASARSKQPMSPAGRLLAAINDGAGCGSRNAEAWCDGKHRVRTAEFLHPQRSGTSAAARGGCQGVVRSVRVRVGAELVVRREDRVGHRLERRWVSRQGTGFSTGTELGTEQAHRALDSGAGLLPESSSDEQARRGEYERPARPRWRDCAPGNCCPAAETRGASRRPSQTHRPRLARWARRARRRSPC